VLDHVVGSPTQQHQWRRLVKLGADLKRKYLL